MATGRALARAEARDRQYVAAIFDRAPSHWFTVRSLARHLGWQRHTEPQLGVLLRRLVAEGDVARRQHPADGRMVQYRLYR